MTMKSLTMVMIAGAALAIFALPSMADEPNASTDNSAATHKSQEKSKQGKHEKMKEKMAKKFTKMDTDHDGKISLAEANANAPRLAEHFADIDKNGDGFVTKEEMKAHHMAKKKDCDKHQRGDHEKD